MSSRGARSCRRRKRAATTGAKSCARCRPLESSAPSQANCPATAMASRRPRRWAATRRIASVCTTSRGTSGSGARTGLTRSTRPVLCGVERSSATIASACCRRFAATSSPAVAATSTVFVSSLRMRRQGYLPPPRRPRRCSRSWPRCPTPRWAVMASSVSRPGYGPGCGHARTRRKPGKPTPSSKRTDGCAGTSAPTRPPPSRRPRRCRTSASA